MGAIINGQTYGWASISAKLPGLDLELQSIDYDDGLEKEVAYGMGALPRGYGKGNYAASCKATLLREDYDELADYIKGEGKGLYSYVIPKITVSYAKEGERIKTDVINRLTVTKVANKGAQGDKSLPVDVEFLVFGTIVRDGLEPV